jgi:hypothetical protein
MKSKRILTVLANATRIALCSGLFILIAVAFGTPTSWAFPTYSNADGVGNCKGCHGDFLASAYISRTDGRNWGNLHNLHRNVMLADGFPARCQTCHLVVGQRPVYTFQSLGNDALDPISCVGCHGRYEDRQDENGHDTHGMGAGLRQHHWNAGITFCGRCHEDADPANFTPVGEHVLPPYYFADGIFTNKPTDSCNPNGEEDYAGLLFGLDNDGDGKYDIKDPDCKPAFGKVVICHIPQGNPFRARTMSINVNALFAHAAHGDLLGACTQ